MKVYMVYYVGWDNTNIFGVFSSEEKAKKMLNKKVKPKKLREDFSIVEMEIDEWGVYN